MNAHFLPKVGLTLALAWSAACERRVTKGIHVAEPVIRVTPGGRVGAVYMKIRMGTDAGDRLIAVESAFAQGVEMHETVQTGDVPRMVARPEGFEISSGETLELSPAGKHLLIFGVTERASGELPLVLRFAKAGTMEVRARVVGISSPL